jgi:metallo-beta-lactamase family protein
VRQSDYPDLCAGSHPGTADRYCDPLPKRQDRGSDCLCRLAFDEPATTLFRKYAERLKDAPGSDIFSHPSIHYIREVAESTRLNSVSGAIVLAASGMCEGGRIRHHLLHNLYRRDSTILYVGFQAAGSLGRSFWMAPSECEYRVRTLLSGQGYGELRATRRTPTKANRCNGSRRRPITGSLLLDHGELPAITELGRLAREQDLCASILVPEIGERYALGAGQPAQRLETGRPELRQAVSRDWQNSYADLATSLKRDLAAIADAAGRPKVIAEMREVLDRYNQFRANKAN